MNKVGFAVILVLLQRTIGVNNFDLTHDAIISPKGWGADLISPHPSPLLSLKASILPPLKWG